MSEEKRRVWTDQDIQKNRRDYEEVERAEIEETDWRGRKVGIARFFQIIGRDFLPFYGSGFLFLLGILPGVLVVYFGMMANSILLSFVGGILGGAVGGPLLCGVYDTVLRSLREEAGYWWYTYKTAWRQNWKQSILPGILMGAFMGIWSWAMIRMPDMEQVPTAVWGCMLMGMMMAVSIGQYYFSQIVLIHLDGKTMLLNAVLFFGGYLPRSIAAGVIVCVYWAIIILYLPYTVPALLVTGVWFPASIALLCVYPALNRALHIEEQLDEKNAQMDLL